MELELVEKDKRSITVRLNDPDTTLINPLINELIADDGVEDVVFRDMHPELEVPTLSIEVKSGKPQTALKRAAKSVGNQYKVARGQLKKKLK